MIVAFSFARPDYALAVKNLKWMAELSGKSPGTILLIHPAEINVTEAYAAAGEAFDTVKTCVVPDADKMPWPFGANLQFISAVNYIEHFKLGPFLWMEPDAIPLDRDWLERIEAEYESCGKAFMGALAGNSTTAPHMNGVGVWHRVREKAPAAMNVPTPQEPDDIARLPKMAFDMAGGAEVLQDFHNSPLFQFAYRKEDECLKDESLSWLRPGAVIYHTEKSGKLIDLLRARPKDAHQQGSQVVRHQAHNLNIAGSIPAPANTCDIFIKTCERDSEWLAYARQSIAKFCSGFRETVIVNGEHERGYLHQQVRKLNADMETDAAHILITDSDTIFTVPVTPGTYLRDGKVIWLMTPFEGALEAEGEGVLNWRKANAALFGIEPEFEFMRRQPFMVPRWLLQAFRMFVWHRHGCSVEDYVMRQETFSEWNALGFYAWLFHREAFYWINTETDEVPPLTVRQYWSHTSIDDVRGEIEELLGGTGTVVEHKEIESELKPVNGSVLDQLAALADADGRRQAAMRARMAKARAAKAKRK